MNNKKGIKKGIIGITLAAIMIASIFAVVVPSTADEDAQPFGYAHAEKVADRADKTYRIGDTVIYNLHVYNDDPDFGATFDVFDTFAHDAEIKIAEDIHVNKKNETGTDDEWISTYSFTIGPEDLEGDKVNNWLRIAGISDNELEFAAEVMEQIIILGDPPEFSFDATGTCCKHMTFVGTAIDPDERGIKNWTWDFGPHAVENAGGGVDPTYHYGETEDPGTTWCIFDTCGDIEVKLYGYDMDDDYGEFSDTVYVDCGPTAVAIAIPPCFEAGGSEITFNGSGSHVDLENPTLRSIESWKWTFSDEKSGSSDDQEETTRMVDDEITATLNVSDGHCYSEDNVSVRPCSECALRIYGTFNEGPGDHTVPDPELPGEIYPENPPYTCPMGPFDPQHDQAPRKDFITLNPAIMGSNAFYLDGLKYPELSFMLCDNGDVQEEKEKVFKRVWYQKEWFKDDDKDGEWDVVVDTPKGPKIMTLDEWDDIPAWKKEKKGWSIREWNNPSDPRCEAYADTYGPAVNQEFTYMFLDDLTMPIMIQSGGRVLIPMAHDAANAYRGLNSFDADGDGVRDYVKVESEETLGFDIDGDGTEEPMGDDEELSGDETVVLVLPEKSLDLRDGLQFFDHKVKLIRVFGPDDRTATLLVSDNEGGDPTETEVTLAEGETAFFYRAEERDTPGGEEGATFFVRVISINHPDGPVAIEVGRMFGQTYANIGGENLFWSQKAFIVDGVFYNVVAIKADDNCIKYITFRQKLPKMPIKLHGKHLEVWLPREVLPEMPPFNMDHDIVIDVQDTWTELPFTQEKKIGAVVQRPPLEIDYIYEGIEERYKGELKEIYNEEQVREAIPICVVYGIDSSGSMVGSDPANLRLEAAKDFTAKLDPDMDKAGVVSWDDDIDFSLALTDDFGLVETMIGTIDSAGMTDLNEGLTESINVMDGCIDPSAAKVIIFLSNGAQTVDDPYDPDIALVAAGKGYKIYSIGLNIPAGSIGEDNLMDMAAATGGKYYPSPTAENLDEIFKEIYEEELVRMDEFWTLEWFKTYPWQYTELRLPGDDKYLVTLSWIAPESEIAIWDSEPVKPVKPVDWYTEERFKFWYQDCTGPIYIDNETSSIRLYGTFGEGPGNDEVPDPELPGEIYPENPPYTCPMGPFDPQHEQAPVKDFMTFNPAIMDHNQGYPELSFTFCGNGDVQEEKEKVFKRMWYQKEWFKDDDNDGEWDVVVDTPEGPKIMTLDDWNDMPAWKKAKKGWTIREWNNPGDPGCLKDADTYGPAINQEFTYMFLDDLTMPIMIQSGSRVLIPMAHDPANAYRGLNSFDALPGDGIDRDYVKVESEETLGFDIDGDGIEEPMDGDDEELSGDETVVLVLPRKTLGLDGEQLQFFDHKVELEGVSGPTDRTAHLLVYDNEGGDTIPEYVDLEEGEKAFFKRGEEIDTPGGEEGATFYVQVISINYPNGPVRIEVGRMFGQTYANIGGENLFWNQKAFIVDEVFYNVVAIKAYDNCIKYITFRQKLPKEEIKLHGTHLEEWKIDPETGQSAILPEMPPFNMDHEILIDVQPMWTKPYSQQDKIGPKESRGPLEIRYVEEDVEERFKGELKEIYTEHIGVSEYEVDEHWNVEWFYTQPDQYTAFVMPADQLYLMTLAWYAPESEITIWNCDTKGPMDYYEYERVKFWYDPGDNTDIYVNRVGPAPPEETIAEYYNKASNGGDGDVPLEIDLQEIVNAIMHYLHDDYPFGDDGPFDIEHLKDYLDAYLTQEGY